MRYISLLVLCCILLCGCAQNKAIIINVKKSTWIEKGWGNGTWTSITDIHDRTLTLKGRHDFTPGETYEVMVYGTNDDYVKSMRKITPGKVNEVKSDPNERQ